MQRFNDVDGEVSVLSLTVECKFVLVFAVGDLVDFKPIDSVIDFCCQGIFDGDGQHFPVGLALVEESNGAQNLHLDDGALLVDLGSDFSNVDRISVTPAVSAVIDRIGIFPGLVDCSVVPDVTLVRVTSIGNVVKVPIFGVKK
jgi:hypothetical protein